MSWLDRVHGRHHHTRRLRVLGQHMADLIPRNARVLDVGCGDGLLTRHVSSLRDDLCVYGVDVLVRQETFVPVEAFDGHKLPYGDGEFDVVMLVDVLHHTLDPLGLLAESVRVARQSVVLKDHTLTGFGARATLSFMDRTSNMRHGVALPCTYWTRERWTSAFESLGVSVDEWNGSLALYPWGSRWVFERSMHFVARLAVA